MGFFPYECSGCQIEDQCGFVDDVVLVIKDNHGNTDVFNAEYTGYGEFEVNTTCGDTIVFVDPTYEGETGFCDPGTYTGVIKVFCNSEKRCCHKFKHIKQAVIESNYTQYT